MAGLPRTRYARSGDLSIAYQAFGDGALDLVVVPGFVTHLDLTWEDPTRREIHHRWGSFARVLVFDKRNTGMSDRTGSAPTIEERMDDIRAVMDDAGVERASLLGYSEGGPLVLAFAATYPERVDALVLIGTYARLDPPADLEEQLALLEASWGTGAPMQLFLGDVDADWAARYERSCATPRAAAEILRLNVELDVSAACSAISAPALVIHRDGDGIVPVEAGRALAAAIPGAQYEELRSDSHMAAGAEDSALEVGLVEQFLTGARRAAEPNRVLATVLFTDVVDSTARAAADGDATWRSKLEQLQGHTDRIVQQFGGRTVKTTGDGVLATFDGPARAIRSARTISDRAASLGLPIRAGLHAGEVELVGDDIAGIAVHLAKRVESAATPGTVYVSRTVRDLVVGSGIEFAERGTHDLKGIPGSWELFEVAAV